MTKKLDEMIDELRGAPLSEVDKFAIRTILESLLETIKETPKTENSNAGQSIEILETIIHLIDIGWNAAYGDSKDSVTKGNVIVRTIAEVAAAIVLLGPNDNEYAGKTIDLARREVINTLGPKLFKSVAPVRKGKQAKNEDEAINGRGEEILAEILQESRERKRK